MFRVHDLIHSSAPDSCFDVAILVCYPLNLEIKRMNKALLNILKVDLLVTQRNRNYIRNLEGASEGYRTVNKRSQLY